MKDKGLIEYSRRGIYTALNHLLIAQLFILFPLNNAIFAYGAGKVNDCANPLIKYFELCQVVFLFLFFVFLPLHVCICAQSLKCRGKK